MTKLLIAVILIMAGFIVWQAGWIKPGSSKPSTSKSSDNPCNLYSGKQYESCMTRRSR